MIMKGLTALGWCCIAVIALALVATLLPASAPPSLDDQLEQAQWGAYFAGSAYENSLRNGAPPAEQEILRRRVDRSIEESRALIARGARSRLVIDPATGQLGYAPGARADAQPAPP
jgi:hypothetical protein